MKLATNDQSDKMFLLTSKFRSQGVVSPCHGVVYTYKIMKKNCIKSDFKKVFLKLVANDRSDKRFLLTSKFFPWGCLPLTCVYIHILNHEKMSIKSEVEEILFKLATNEAFLLTSKFWPNGLSAPAQGPCPYIKSWKKCA